jgi:hypothetical protein
MRFNSPSLKVKGSLEAHYGRWLVATGIVILALASDTLIKSFTAMLHLSPLVDSMTTLVWTISLAAWEAPFYCLSPVWRWTGSGRAE